MYVKVVDFSSGLNLELNKEEKHVCDTFDIPFPKESKDDALNRKTVTLVNYGDGFLKNKQQK